MPVRSSVRLLETRSGALTSELLGLAAAGIGNKQALVVLDQQFLELALGLLVLVLLGEGNDGLCDGLAQSLDLRGRTTAADTAANVQALEANLAQKKDGLHELHSHRDGFDDVH